MDSENKIIDNYYQQNVTPVLNKLNLLRKTIVRKGIISQFTLIGLILAFFIRSYFKNKTYGLDINGVITIFKIVFPVSLVILTIKPYKFLLDKAPNKYRATYKFEIVEVFLKTLAENLTYYPFFKTSNNHIIKSQLFGKKISDNFEKNGIVGKKDEVKFRISEMRLMKGIITIFSGVLLIIETDFDYKLRTIQSNTPDLETSKTNQYFNRLNDILNKFNPIGSEKVRYSIIENEIYIAIEIKREIFEINFKTFQMQEQRIKDDLLLFYNIFQLISEIQLLVK